MRLIRLLMLLVVLTVVVSSCGGERSESVAPEPSLATVNETEVTEVTAGTGAAFSAEADDPEACEPYSRLLLTEESDYLDTTSSMWRAELRSSLEAADPEAASAWDVFIQSVDAGTDPEFGTLSDEDKNQHTKDWIAAAREVDRSTFEACGLPLVSALDQVDGGFEECTSGEDGMEVCITARANTWPCFTLADSSGKPGRPPWLGEDGNDEIDYYQAIDCESGTPVEASLGPVWTAFDPAQPKFVPVDE